MWADQIERILFSLDWLFNVMKTYFKNLDYLHPRILMIYIYLTLFEFTFIIYIHVIHKKHNSLYRYLPVISDFKLFLWLLDSLICFYIFVLSNRLKYMIPSYYKISKKKKMQSQVHESLSTCMPMYMYVTQYTCIIYMHKTQF